MRKRLVHLTIIPANRCRFDVCRLTPNPVRALALILALVAGAAAAHAGSGTFGDHQNMMDQLGIKRLRPGANPNNQSTFDEATANPYADSMPDVLRMKDTTKVTEAFDTRVAVGLIGSSGEGGVKLHRHIYGEAVENLAGGEYYWMAGTM